MDRHTRKELKTDKFAQGVGSSFEFLSEHRGQATRWGLIALAVVVIIGGIWVYRSHQATQRAELLAKAMQIDGASVGAPQPPRLNFPTVEDKEKAVVAAFTDVAVKYPGSQEAAIAQLAVAATQADKGQIDEALKTFKDVMDTAPDPYNSVAKLSIAEIYVSQGKADEAEKLLRQLVDQPTMFVSKEQATLDLAQLIGKKNPAEARKLLEPLSASKRPALSAGPRLPPWAPSRQTRLRRSLTDLLAGPLDRLRFPVERSRGRRYPELAHPYRNEFRRDRDRVVHARAFRRLENKTQVFTPGLSDHFRNRLTHTIEVSQIARTVASALGLSEDLTEALALAHDIGHPPFGHAGEAELDSMMRRFGERFDHNLHALRIVESFENPYPRFPGLNLTFEVREGIVKHSRDFAPGEYPALDEYLPGLRPPLEAQLIDLGDEIAYNTSDLDDGYSAGMIVVEEACSAVNRFAELYEITEYQFPGLSDRVRLKEVVRGLIDGLVTGLIEGTVEACEAGAGLTSVEDVRLYPARAARFTPEAAKTSAQLKKFLRESVYESPELVRARSESVSRIAGLFELLLEHPDRMPAVYREESAGQPLHRQVCDYIAGMTDGFFLRTASQLGVESSH